MSEVDRIRETGSKSSQWQFIEFLIGSVEWYGFACVIDKFTCLGGVVVKAKGRVVLSRFSDGMRQSFILT